MSSVVGSQPVVAPVAELETWRDEPVEQQPHWHGHPEYSRVRRELMSVPPLVSVEELMALRQSVAAVAAGDARMLQIGDCAESLDECTDEHVFAKVEALDVLADNLENRTGQPVVRVGRMGGQFAKPRSRPIEWHDGTQLQVFRGHLVNSEVPTPEERRHNPLRMLWAYQASARVHDRLGRSRQRRAYENLGPLGSGPWSSHEALALDYETSLTRVDPTTGATFLASTHLPWIGERTRDPDGAHVRLLASVENPIGCKIGPSADPAEVVRLCDRLDPLRVPGRLVLIPRMGRDAVEEALPAIVAAVRRRGHSVAWLCDPMHGNTRLTPNGVKTRYLSHILAESTAFRRVLERQGQHPGGLHLEVAAADVTECVGGLIENEELLGAHYTTLCDPRLNVGQAFQLLEACR
jgi:3-deoxy-7-phosphoheptulonate synthase